MLALVSFIDCCSKPVNGDEFFGNSNGKIIEGIGHWRGDGGIGGTSNIGPSAGTVEKLG